jgi:hypothetical protein
VKVSGTRRCKLDHHDFTGIFLGYTAMDQNIMYLNLTSGIVKSCHHAIFDEAWYLQPHQPPAAQLLYDLGIKSDTEYVSLDGPLHPTLMGTIKPITVAWPPTSIIPPSKLKCLWDTPSLALYAPLLL